MFAIRAPAPQTEEFERSFWAGGNLHALHQDRPRRKTRRRAARWNASSKPAWANSSRPRPAGTPPRSARHAAPARRRAPRHARRLPARNGRARIHLTFLASVGSVSPYVGLLGTVWGIMNAFRGLANVQQATLAAVAPGHRRSADRHRHRPVRGDSGGGRLQPLHPRHRPPGDPLRELRRRVLEHPAAPVALRSESMASSPACAAAAAASSSPRSTSCRTST